MKQNRNMISNVVFTKDRPLQLDAYLESLYRHFPSGLYQTYILYKVGVFQEEYQHLFRKYPRCIVIEENDFHSDFLKLLEQISTKFILFGVDDVVYFDLVDFDVINETFDSFSKDFFGFSLRFGRETVEKGGDRIGTTVIDGQTVYSINWTQGRTPNTRYPFELCATIYPTELVKRVIRSVVNHNPLVRKLFLPNAVFIKVLGKIISTHSILRSFGYFCDPNTLEYSNCRWCQNHSDKLPAFLFFQRQCASAVQVNTVNISINNEFNGSAEHTVKDLAARYSHGYRFDIDFLVQNKPTGTHSGKENFKLIKKF